MATLSRLEVTWSGTPVTGGGISTFYSSNSDPTAFYTAVRAFFVAVGPSIASGVTFSFSPSGDTIESTTGQINGSWSLTTPTAVAASGSSNWAMGVGTRVRWLTAGITRGRRVRGSTFLVPLGGNLYDGTGSIADATVSTLATAAVTLAAADSGSMRIYSRPTSIAAADGVAHAVTGSDLPDRVSWLRSRRT